MRFSKRARSRAPAAGRVLAGSALLALVLLAMPASAQTDIRIETGIHYATHGGIPLALDAYLPPGQGPFLISIPFAACEGTYRVTAKVLRRGVRLDRDSHYLHVKP